MPIFAGMSGWLSALYRNTDPSGQILYKLPGYTARAGAARGRPLERFAVE